VDLCRLREQGNNQNLLALQRRSGGGVVLPGSSGGGTQGWQDPDFPPSKSSLSHAPKALSRDERKAWSSLVWRRPSDVNDSAFHHGLFGANGEPSPSDVVQGPLGDCYFIAALSALAQRPDRIRRCVEVGSESLTATGHLPAGVATVHLYPGGIPLRVLVDDHFPVQDVHGTGGLLGLGNAVKLAFASSADGGMWVPCIEKAWAKLHGTSLSLSVFALN
jgi:hypothetical protein